MSTATPTTPIRLGLPTAEGRRVDAPMNVTYGTGDGGTAWGRVVS